MQQDLEELREAMEYIHERTMHIDPRNVHASDGQKFEDTLQTVIMKAGEVLPIEDRQIAGLMEPLST